MTSLGRSHLAAKWIRSVLVVFAAACRHPDRVSPSESTSGVLVATVVQVGKECPDCLVELTKLGTLGSLDDSVLLDRNSSCTLLADGRFVCAPTAEPGLAVVFDSLNGMAHPFGHRGDGPGESSSGIRTVLPWLGDTALIYESFRLTFLSGTRGTGRSERYSGIETGFSAVTLPNDRIIAVNNKDIGTAQFVVLDANGAILRQMGMPSMTGGSYLRDAVVGPSRTPHAFWAGATRFRHRVEEWSIDGMLLTTFDSTPAWFVPYDAAALDHFIKSSAQATKPLPFLEAIRETAQGRLILLYMTGARDWHAVDSIPARTAADRRNNIFRRYGRRSAYDAVLEVLDAASGRIQLVEWLSLPITGFINDTLAYDRVEGADGVWRMDIYRMQLRHLDDSKVSSPSH